VIALLPPAERRGLVFMDPPFEDAEEFRSLASAIRRAHGRFGHGLLAGWYPIKRQAAVHGFYSQVAELAIRDIIAVEFRLRETHDPSRFSGCGMIVVNPPHLFVRSAHDMADAVLRGLGPPEPGAGVELIRLADE
jgi:23S rRNA (adenine2030-N6)-methyltransferase